MLRVSDLPLSLPSASAIPAMERLTMNTEREDALLVPPDLPESLEMTDPRDWMEETDWMELMPRTLRMHHSMDASLACLDRREKRERVVDLVPEE